MRRSFAVALGVVGAFTLVFFAWSISSAQPALTGRSATEVDPAPPTEGSIATTLFRLHWRSFDLVSHGFTEPGSGTSIAIRGDRVLIAERTGHFFEVRFNASDVEVHRTVLQLETNYRLLEQYSESISKGADDITHRNRFVGVTDLVFLGDGEALAAAYMHWDAEEKCVTTRVAVTRLTDNWPESAGNWHTVFVSKPCVAVTSDTFFRGHFAGGRLAEVRPGVLYLTIGDYARDGVHNPQIFAQDRTVSYGKIVAIELESGEHRIVSIGHRNPQGLLVDSRGRIWSTEHGPKGGDELNLIREGRNYGWPHVTLGADYFDYVWPLASEQGRHVGYEPPVFAWVPSAAVNQLIEIRSFAPEWDGDLLVAFLGSQRLGRLRLDGERVVYEEPIRIGERIRDIAQLGDGRIMLWTDSGKLMLLVRDRVDSVITRLLVSMPEGVRTVFEECTKCHVLDGPSAGGRISLWRIHGRRIDAEDWALYAEEPARWRGEWTGELLDAYLEDPGRVMPGRTMQHPAIKDMELRRDVIRYLKELH